MLLRAELAQDVLAGTLLHGFHERRGPMRRMKCNQRELAGFNASHDVLTGRRRDFPVAHVAPPNQDIAGIEHCRAQSLVGILQPS